MHARSAVVDLYGDHLGGAGWAPVKAVVALAATCGVQPAATRTAVSRLVREGWLAAREVHGARGYAVTPHARERLDRTRRRVYAEGPAPWDGRWHLVCVDLPQARALRDRVTSSLGFLGYGRLGPGTWLSPRTSPELVPTLDRLGVGCTAFVGRPEGLASDRQLGARVWDLEALAAAYRELGERLPEPETVRGLTPEEAYRRRVALVHEWRKFLFVDPDLPLEVLPRDWPGQAVRDRVLILAGLLRPEADSYVAGVLAAHALGPGVA